jgi:hypothetical protein
MIRLAEESFAALQAGKKDLSEGPGIVKVVQDLLAGAGVGVGQGKRPAGHARQLRQGYVIATAAMYLLNFLHFEFFDCTFFNLLQGEFKKRVYSWQRLKVTLQMDPCSPKNTSFCIEAWALLWL